MTKGVFSEFEVQEQHIKVVGESSFLDMNCVGSSEEELEVKVITKNCRGVVAKKKVKGTGNGTLTESLHVPYNIYNMIYDMVQSDELLEGVVGYGQKSTHPEFALTQKVLDEDDVVKLKAYPRCILESGPKRPVENGAEEVPELELTISLLPDEYGYCMYEALASAVTSTVADTWLTAFTPDLVRPASGQTDAEGETDAEGQTDAEGATGVTTSG